MPILFTVKGRPAISGFFVQGISAWEILGKEADTKDCTLCSKPFLPHATSLSGSSPTPYPNSCCSHTLSSFPPSQNSYPDTGH